MYHISLQTGSIARLDSTLHWQVALTIVSYPAPGMDFYITSMPTFGTLSLKKVMSSLVYFSQELPIIGDCEIK